MWTQMNNGVVLRVNLFIVIGRTSVHAAINAIATQALSDVTWTLNVESSQGSLAYIVATKPSVKMNLTTILPVGILRNTATKSTVNKNHRFYKLIGRKFVKKIITSKFSYYLPNCWWHQQRSITQQNIKKARIMITSSVLCWVFKKFNQTLRDYCLSSG